MDILTPWLRSYLPALDVTDAQLAEDLTLRGIAVEGTFPLEGGGTRYEMDITTNRVDAMNHYGVAREVAAIYNVALKPIAETAAVAANVEGAAYPVRIEAQDLCGRFTARVVRGVAVKASTGKIAEYFRALGQKPISGPVDVTNFGWLAMGQPTHVFDLDTLEGAIVVRRAKAGERLRLLDGSDKVLVADDLVVADEKKALALAGVMGGWESRVTEATKNILVEAAWFDPAAIRASSRRHGLHTDASHRFERGADFAAAPLANNLVTRLVVEQAGGEVAGPMTDVVIPALAAKTADRAPIALRVSEVQRHLGTTADGAGIREEIVARYLTALGCSLTETAKGAYAVKLPSWRLDLEREIDLIEEVARVYGYNKFANTLPTFTGTVVELPQAAAESAIRTTLRALGYSEAISSTFCAAEEAAAFASAPAVALGNPLSAEAGMLRPALTPGMATMLAHNLHRDVTTVRLFEMGTVFTGSTAKVNEHVGLSLGLTGDARATALYKAEDALFYELKGTLEAVLAKFAGVVTLDAQELPAWVAAGRGARVLLDGAPVAVFGELAAAEAQKRKLRQTVAMAEVNAAALLERALRQPVSQEISRYQAVERDFSFVFPDSVRWEAIEAAVRGLGVAELQSVAPVEIFRDAKGKAIAAGSYSLLTRVVFQSTERTLAEEDLTGSSARIVVALTGLGGVQRA
ncbi:phenylalanine--tRNA ligase subunit beta [Granulicella sp. 5B5]|uniref:phenylalanine--tRNA ligase subunit beta n=1 Tax=Granulicella sp. 5B5 TaxID=1617967 RepID=UPI0015F70079|nr:phenylalanine--tRNA ligase subunit beta [Granulicella sp. 5B5]QMV18682.1 phenylalanine--tRNA ligase subunit beta [Granulicella sp. 5B5]